MENESSFNKVIITDNVNILTSDKKRKHSSLISYNYKPKKLYCYGIAKTCSICNRKKATVKCATCGVVHYCSKDHRKKGSTDGFVCKFNLSVNKKKCDICLGDINILFGGMFYVETDSHNNGVRICFKCHPFLVRNKIYIGRISNLHNEWTEKLPLDITLDEVIQWENMLKEAYKGEDTEDSISRWINMSKDEEFPFLWLNDRLSRLAEMYKKEDIMNWLIVEYYKTNQTDNWIHVKILYDSLLNKLNKE